MSKSMKTNSKRSGRPQPDAPPVLRYRESRRWRNWLALANKYPHGMLPPGVRVTLRPGKRVRVSDDDLYDGASAKKVHLTDSFRVSAVAALPLPAAEEFVAVDALDKLLSGHTSITVTTDRPMSMAFRIDPAIAVTEYDDGTSRTNRRTSSGYLMWSSCRAICEAYDVLHERGCRQLTQPGSLWIEEVCVRVQEGVVHLFMGT